MRLDFRRTISRNSFVNIIARTYILRGTHLLVMRSDIHQIITHEVQDKSRIVI